MFLSGRRVNHMAEREGKKWRKVPWEKELEASLTLSHKKPKGQKYTLRLVFNREGKKDFRAAKCFLSRAGNYDPIQKIMKRENSIGETKRNDTKNQRWERLYPTVRRYGLIFFEVDRNIKYLVRYLQVDWLKTYKSNVLPSYLMRTSVQEVREERPLLPLCQRKWKQ